MRLATIDLGTNMIRLLVADTAGSDWRAVDQAQRVTRLGDGQGPGGPLLAEPMARTLDTVVEFVRRAEASGAARVRIAATSAVDALTVSDRGLREGILCEILGAVR